MATKEEVSIRVEKNGTDVRLTVETLPRTGDSVEYIRNLEVTTKKVVVEDPDLLLSFKKPTGA